MIENDPKTIFENFYHSFYAHESSSLWDFGDSILYDMCRQNPEHKRDGVIIGKVWLIGRSYAAAIERRRDGIYKGTDFYRDVVAPKMKEFGPKLDKRIARINSGKADTAYILETHKLLTDVFSEMTALNKRSLASKYLHFHCPASIYIYDSRARQAINKLVRRPDKSILRTCTVYDDEYADFCCRVAELVSFFEANNIVTDPEPRLIDRFLLYCYDVLCSPQMD